MAYREPYESLEARLLANSAPYDGGYISDCWFWLGNCDADGYGRITMRLKGDKDKGIPGRHVKRRAHRVSYEVFVGPIPLGLDVDHKCENRWCIAPDHLEPCEVVRNRGEFVRYGHPDRRCLSDSTKAICP